MSQRNAKEPVLDGIIGLASGTYAFGLVALPPSLANAPTLGRFATVILFLGCATALVGYSWPHRYDGMSIQQFGQPLIFFGSVFYATALMSSTAAVGNALFAFAFTLGVGVAALVRWFQLRSRLKKLTRDAVQRNGQRDG